MRSEELTSLGLVHNITLQQFFQLWEGEPGSSTWALFVMGQSASQLWLVRASAVVLGHRREPAFPYLYLYPETLARFVRTSPYPGAPGPGARDPVLRP